MKKKIFLSLFSIFLAVLISEIILRFLNLPPELNKDFQRKDLSWTEKNVVLNSAGYRDKEYTEDRLEDAFRIYTLGDSYTYGWLVDNQQDVFTEIIENQLNKKLDKKVEVINAGSPGFSIDEMINRFISEGKYYYPDLVVIGINDDEANYTKTYQQPKDQKLSKFIRNLHLYQMTIGNYFKLQAEKANHDYTLNIYTDNNSSDWEKFSQQMLLLKDEANKINAKVAIILFPHIHPKTPNDAYDYYPFNEKFKKFAEKNDMFIIDPLDDFLAYPEKKNLVINPLDPHPTSEMNNLVANAFLKQFNVEDFLKNHQKYTPLLNNIELSRENNSIGPYKLIKKINYDSEIPWVYFETKNGTSIQSFPLKDKTFRKTNIYTDQLHTAKSFTHAGIAGATLEYHLYPEEKGIIKIPTQLYGFNVVGINHIFALKVSSYGDISSDYISPETISKSEKEFVIKYNPDENYHNYRVNLTVAVKQIDINPQGQIENAIETEILATKISETTESAFLPLSEKVSSWQVFSDEPGKNQPVAFIDGVMTRISSVKVDNDGVTLNFFKDVLKDQEIRFAVSRNYNLFDNEKITIEFE